MIAFILLLFGSMAYAILSTVAKAEDFIQEPSTPWTPPAIEQCELPLWDRIRYLCPQEGDE